jgi:hypothetical protein
MLEIEKIKDFIDKNSKKLYYELYGTGAFAKNVSTIINKNDNLLIVYEGAPVSENEIFRLSEAWFKVPSKKEIQKRINAHLNGEFDEGICHHWVVRKIKNDEMLIVSHLCINNYIKSLEISK